MAIAKKKRNVKRGNAGIAAKTAVRNKNLEPIWTGWEQMTGEQFFKHKQSSIRYYYTTFKLADLLANVYGWMKENDYSKEDIRAAKAASSGLITATAAIHSRMLSNGMPDLNPEEQNYYEEMPGLGDTVAPVTDYIKERVRLAIQNGKINLALKKEQEPEQEVPTGKPYIPTIQERISEQAGTMSEEIDEWLESFLDNKKSFDPKGFDFKRHFTAKGVTQAHARKLKKFYDEQLADFRALELMPTTGQLNRMPESEADQWLQLKEAYSHFSKTDRKKYTSAINSVIEALDFIIEASKAQRKPRKAKPKSATKLVEKLKYCLKDDKFQLASIAAENIIGANELWVFNVKYRKLGKYVAKNIDNTGQNREGSGLSVKGASITGFDPQASIQKTLRKPIEQLKEFKTAGKVKLRKFIDDIPTTDTLLNGRCNNYTILLKVQ